MNRLTKISRNFAMIHMDDFKGKVDLRDDLMVAAIRAVFWFNPLSMPVGSMIEIDARGIPHVSDNLGIPTVGRPTKGVLPISAAERARAYRKRKKHKELFGDE